MYLGNVSSLGEEVMAAFAAVMGAAALKVVRGVVLMRPTAGLEERAKSTQLLQELVKWLPPDLFRTCLSRVCASHGMHSVCVVSPRRLRAETFSVTLDIDAAPG